MPPNKYIEAIQAIDIDRVRATIAKDPKWLTWAEPLGKNALHYLCAVRVGEDHEKQAKSLDLLKFLLKNGMEIDSEHRIDDENCDHFPATPLWYAYAKGRNEKIWKYLLRQGAEPNGCWWAIAWYDDIAAAKYFLKHGADLSVRPGSDDLFVGAFGWKKYEFAHWLLSMGADVNSQDPQGNTALIVAVKRKDETQIARLIQAGADPDRRNNKGDSARSIAAAKGPKRLLNLL